MTTLLGAGDDAEHGDTQGDGVDPTVSTKKRKRNPAKKRKRKGAGKGQLCSAKTTVPVDEEPSASAKPAWEYNRIRMNFIEKYKAENSANFNDAKAAWELSAVKRQYLCNVPLAELKRRKFVPKDSEVNPWSDES